MGEGTAGLLRPAGKFSGRKLGLEISLRFGQFLVKVEKGMGPASEVVKVVLLSVMQTFGLSH